MNLLKRLQKRIFDPVILLSWRRVIENWKKMLIWTILVWVFMAIFFGPVSSWLLRLRLFRSGRLVVSNTELLDWILSPLGLAYIAVAFILMLIGVVIHFAGIFQIVSDQRKKENTPIFQTFLHIMLKVPALVKLCFIAVATSLLLIFILLSGGVLIYSILLSEHDINFYLTLQPTELYWAIGSAVLWFLLWLGGVLYLLARILLIFPAYLDGYKPLKKALRKSWQLAKERGRRFVKLLITAIGLWFLITLLLDAVWLFLASLLIKWAAYFFSSLRLVALLSGLYVAIRLLLGSLTSFLGFSFVSTMITKYYFDDTDLHNSVPVNPKFRRLKKQTLSIFTTLLKPKYILLFTGSMFIASAFISGLILQRVPELEPVKIIAHRAGLPPENTLSALESSIAAQAEYAEIDVQFTLDETIVVVHDADVMRVAGDRRLVSQTHYSALADIVQIPSNGSPSEERKIATLQEFIVRAKDRINLMIELKYYNSQPGLVKEVIQQIKANDFEEQTMIVSLNLEKLKEAKIIAPELKTGFVSAVTIGDLSKLPVDALIINQRNMDSQLLQRAHKQNMEVYVWTINNADTMVEMIELGVDGIITDYPDLAVKVRNELLEMTMIERLLLRFQKFVVPKEDVDYEF